MRHRRRCQGPKSSNLRRKACDSCVRAKARCCYSQPTCLRCRTRGKTCVYSTPPTASISSTLQELGGRATNASLAVEPRTPASQDVAPFSQNFDLEMPNYGISDTAWPFDTLDLSFTPGLSPSTSNSQCLTMDESFMHDVLNETQPAYTKSTSSRSQDHSVPITTPASSMDVTDFDRESIPLDSTAIVKTLSEYSALLSNDSHSSPFLHGSFYKVPGNDGRDMAFLPHTSMAICCASSSRYSPDKIFFRRAMDAARQKIIQNFVSVVEIVQLRLSAKDDLANTAVFRTMGRTACYADLRVYRTAGNHE